MYPTHLHAKIINKHFACYISNGDLWKKLPTDWTPQSLPQIEDSKLKGFLKVVIYITTTKVVFQLPRRIQLFTTPWTTACQVSLSLIISQSLPEFMSTESVMPFNHLILYHPLLLLPSIFPSIRVFSNEPADTLSLKGNFTSTSFQEKIQYL